MYCRKCGKTIPQDSEFCMHCGTKVVLVEEVLPVPVSPEEHAIDDDSAPLEIPSKEAIKAEAIPTPEPEINPVVSEPEPGRFTKNCPHCKHPNTITEEQIDSKNIKCVSCGEGLFLSGAELALSTSSKLMDSVGARKLMEDVGLEAKAKTPAKTTPVPKPTATSAGTGTQPEKVATIMVRVIYTFVFAVIAWILNGLIHGVLGEPLPMDAFTMLSLIVIGFVAYKFGWNHSRFREEE
jgi:RNA polymerase subunit RPABC4/transcription elongation factor Spt4/ribosomal protein S27E